MQHPATILRKWCESENLMETSLSIPLLGLAPASTPLCDARYKLCTLAVASGRFSSPARLGERAHDRLVEPLAKGRLGGLDAGSVGPRRRVRHQEEASH